MGYKKQEWIELSRNGTKFELTIRDQDWKKIETKKFNPQNFNKIMREIGDRYGINKRIQIPAKEIQNEIDWLRKESILN